MLKKRRTTVTVWPIQGTFVPFRTLGSNLQRLEDKRAQEVQIEEHRQYMYSPSSMRLAPPRAVSKVIGPGRTPSKPEGAYLFSRYLTVLLYMDSYICEDDKKKTAVCH